MQILPYNGAHKPRSPPLAILLFSILLLTITNPSSSSRPLHLPPPPPVFASDPILTFFLTGIADSGPRRPPPPSQTPPFTARNGVPSSYLPLLNPTQTLQPGVARAINEEFKGIRVEGIYVSSLEDNNNNNNNNNNNSKSYIVAMKATWPKLIGGGLDDTLRFFGVLPRVGASESHIAVVGGTGKYRGANGIAVIKAIGGGECDGGEGFNEVIKVAVYLK